MKCMAWLLFEFNVEANIYVPFHNELKPTSTSSLINCFDLFGQMLSFNPIVLPIIYQRHTLILSNIRQFHSRCSSAAIKCSTSKHMIVCFSSNGLLWTIGDNWIACIMGCNGQISLHKSGEGRKPEVFMNPQVFWECKKYYIFDNTSAFDLRLDMILFRIYWKLFD